MTLRFLPIIFLMFFALNSQAQGNINYLMYFSAGFLDFPEDSYAFYLTEDGTFYRMNHSQKIKKVGIENSSKDLSELIAKIQSLPASLTSMTFYDRYGCPNDPLIGSGGELTMIIAGDQFKDGKLYVENVKKDCVWNKVDKKTKAKINELVDYFNNAKSVLLKE